MIGILGAGKYAEAILGQRRQIQIVSFSDQDFPVETGQIAGQEAVYIHRFGWGDGRAAHLIRYDHYVQALQALEVKIAFTLNGFGGVNPKMQVGDLAVPDDIVLFLANPEPPTIFSGQGWRRVDVGAGVGGPYCPAVRAALIKAAQTTKREVWEEATNIVVQGPSLETIAEIEALRRMGADIVSTAPREPKLMKEGHIHYGSLCWISDSAGQQPVTDWKSPPSEELKAVVEYAVALLSQQPLTCQCQKFWDQEDAKYRATTSTV